MAVLKYILRRESRSVDGVEGKEAFVRLSGKMESNTGKKRRDVERERERRKRRKEKVRKRIARVSSKLRIYRRTGETFLPVEAITPR